eukprot:813222-Amphidinium_carterae.1
MFELQLGGPDLIHHLQNQARTLRHDALQKGLGELLREHLGKPAVKRIFDARHDALMNKKRRDTESL